VPASNGSAPAIPAPARVRPWQRRRYQLSLLLVAALLVGGLIANNLIARQYTPEGAVRQYLSALQAGDASTAWSNVQVSGGDKSAINLTGREALVAALASGRPDIKSFAITQTTMTNQSTAAVSFSYETANGTNQGSFVVKRSSQNNLLLYPGWQVVLAPVVLQVSLPPGSGGVMVDGKEVAISHKGEVAVLPLAHQIRFPGTALVQPQTVVLDGFGSQPTAVVYKPTLTPTGEDKATAALKTAFSSCASQTGLSPDGCPQLVTGVVVNSGQWQLIGDPTQGLTFPVDTETNLVAEGHFQLVFNYHESGVDGTIHRTSAGGYAATLSLGSDSVSVAGIKRATGLAAVPRPAAATDEAVLAIVAKALTACASVRSGNPGACPQLFVFPGAKDFRWTLVTDPLTLARVSYDGDTGLFIVRGAFEMKLNYTLNGYPYTTYSNTTEYDAYLFWDGQQLVLISIDGE
jgi:hypothetical protein